MAEIDVKSDKKSSNNDKTCLSKDCFRHRLSEIERHFKRLKVDESDKQSTNGSKSDYQVNYFSPKLSPYPPKISSTEKRQSISGFRRQRLHIINKMRTNCENSSKSRPTEEECVAKGKELRFCTDFSELKLKSGHKSQDNANHKFFHKEFKLESNEWRNSVKEYHKMYQNSDYPTTSKVKNNKKKKVHFNDDKSCARQAMDANCDASADELAAYLDDTLFLPRKMSFMAEMMYT